MAKLNTERLTGLPSAVVRDLTERVASHTKRRGGGTQRVQALVLLALFLLKHAPAWEMAVLLWSTVLEQPPTSKKILQQELGDLLSGLYLPFDSESRHKYEYEALPGVHSIIGCVQVRVPAAVTASAAGKRRHSAAAITIRKYQVRCDLQGITYDVRPIDATPGGGADAAAASASVTRTLFSLLAAEKPETEWIIGDRGYKGIEHIVTPFKRPHIEGEPVPLSVEQVRYNMFHEAARSEIDHVFTRLRRCKLFSTGSPYNEVLTDQLVRLGFWLDAEFSKGSFNETANDTAAPWFITPQETMPDESGVGDSSSDADEDRADAGVLGSAQSEFPKEQEEAASEKEEGVEPRSNQDAAEAPRAVALRHIKTLTDRQFNRLIFRGELALIPTTRGVRGPPLVSQASVEKELSLLLFGEGRARVSLRDETFLRRVLRHGLNDASNEDEAAIVDEQSLYTVNGVDIRGLSTVQALTVLAVKNHRGSVDPRLKHIVTRDEIWMERAAIQWRGATVTWVKKACYPPPAVFEVTHESAKEHFKQFWTRVRAECREHEKEVAQRRCPPRGEALPPRPARRRPRINDDDETDDDFETSSDTSTTTDTTESSDDSADASDAADLSDTPDSDSD